MRIITLLCLFLATATFVLAQQRVDAREILRQIDDGKAVSYKNVEIEGYLDFTDLHNRRKTKSNWDFFGGNSTYESTVEASISFINCTFLDDVLAYYNDDRDDDTFIAHFEGDVTFQNCTFRRKSEFKYSEFNEGADFSGTEFNREANFKYAEFSSMPYFSKVNFRDDANFKYAEFPRGADFGSAVFRELANFKYTKFSTPLNMKEVSFQGSEDFKYTEVDGHSFTSYLLKNR